MLARIQLIDNQNYVILCKIVWKPGCLFILYVPPELLIKRGSHAGKLFESHVECGSGKESYTFSQKLHRYIAVVFHIKQPASRFLDPVFIDKCPEILPGMIIDGLRSILSV